MKIMIVEDELNIREGLKDMIDWREEGFQNPVLFSSAVEALRYLEIETVDVVITDLYMPVLNGIEFIRMLRERNQLCEVIILTGHERFDLAQEAITLGVKRYLLKPITEIQFQKVLREVRMVIQEKMQLKDWVAIAEKRIQDYLPVIRNQFWNDILLGNLRDVGEIEKRAKYAEIYMPDRELSCLAIRRKGETWIEEGMAMRQLIEEILKDKFIYALSYHNVELVICSGRISRFHVEILEESIRQNFGVSVCIGVSTMLEGILNVRTLSAEAMDAAWSVHEDDAIFYVYYKDIESKRKRKVEYPYAEEQRIIDYIRFQKSPDREWLDAFFNKVLPPQYSVEESRILLLQFLSTLGRIGNELGIDIIEEFKETESGIYKFEKIEDCFFDLIKKITEEKIKASRNYTEVIVETAVNYMKKNYSDPELSVGKISEISGVTPNYLSRVFKSVKGETCIDFLTNLRMEAAKELLRYSEKKSYEIAEESGYTNPNYFGALFKKYTGKTPKEYREDRI